MQTHFQSAIWHSWENVTVTPKCHMAGVKRLFSDIQMKFRKNNVSD